MISRSSDRATCRKILASRAAAGNPCTTCPTCVRPRTEPYVSWSTTTCLVIAQACVDACHTPEESFVGPTFAKWWKRPEARAIRRAEWDRVSK